MVVLKDANLTASILVRRTAKQSRGTRNLLSPPKWSVPAQKPCPEPHHAPRILTVSEGCARSMNPCIHVCMCVRTSSYMLVCRVVMSCHVLYLCKYRTPSNTPERIFRSPTYRPDLYVYIFFWVGGGGVEFQGS